ncbi:MAG: sialate O-acetylesterase [Planctomycetes bacterium]|nr:sialate O-acetylesterase [Planctomycetota bacterium]
MRCSRFLGTFAALALIGLTPVHAPADVTLSGPFSTNMVLQRERPVPVWGTARPGETIRVSIAGQTKTAKTDAQGNWKVTLDAMQAGGPHVLSVKGSSAIAVTGVLIGEVWLCSGQSNMNWIVLHSKNHDAEMVAANYPQIRVLHVRTRRSEKPTTVVKAPWQVCSRKTIAYTPAVPYFFGRRIHKELNVPVGLVVSAVNGTRIEPWTPAVGVKSVAALVGKDKPVDGELYNGMIHPLAPMAMRGVIWYQGEGNVGDGMLYYHRMEALINGWRATWGRGDFPFYYVQLAPLNWGGKPKDQLPAIWEAQTAALKITNTGMIVTNDVGNIGTAHPRNKQAVGNRLAVLALAKTYGKKNLVYSGPLYKSMRVEGDKIHLTFAHTASGLASRDGKPLSWFTIAGSDKKFVPAAAKIDGKSLIISSPAVKRPVAVRFGWHQIAEPNLMNKAGLPASSFRTDRW